MEPGELLRVGPLDQVFPHTCNLNLSSNPEPSTRNPEPWTL